MTNAKSKMTNDPVATARGSVTVDMVAETKPTWAISGSNFARAWLNRLGPLLGLILVIAVFAILIGNPERYLSFSGLRHRADGRDCRAGN